MALRNKLKFNYYGFLGLLGLLGFVDPWYFFFFLFFLFFIARRSPAKRDEGGLSPTRPDLIERQAKEKAEHKQKILDLLATQDLPAQAGKITNDHVQKLLGVSDKTVQRHFNELQAEGKIKQVGDTGKGVYYTKAQ